MVNSSSVFASVAKQSSHAYFSLDCFGAQELIATTIQDPPCILEKIQENGIEFHTKLGKKVKEFEMLSQYEAAKKIADGSPEKKALINRTEEVLGRIVRQFDAVGLSKVTVLQQREVVYRAIGGAEGSEEYKAFMEKRQLYANRWKNEEDSEDKRLLWPTLLRNLDCVAPVAVAILSDNPSFVDEKLSTIDLENCLNMACLFGSRQTTEYLMGKLGINDYKHLGEKFFVSMCLSLNVDWVKEVFSTKLNSILPSDIVVEELSEEMRMALLPSPKKDYFKP